MPQLTDRNQQTSSEELFEASMTGPFGGIQSELPPTQIEAFGFANSLNMLFRKGFAQVRPGFTPLPVLPAPTNEPYMAVADFFNINGVQIQCILTPTRLLQYSAGAWVQITGAAFGGSASQLFSWDVVNYKLCFSQGIDKIWYWDGIAATYNQTSASAPPAKYLAEVGLHLLAVNPLFPERYYWSGIGDPTDWTGFTSGLNDNVSNLGPINGVLKIGQYGYGFHQKGILQIVPTGIGLAPFAFTPVNSSVQSAIAPYSIAHMTDNGQELGVYLGVDNVYVFNGTSATSIGDAPIGDGSRRRLGARSRILADVQAGNPQTIYGFCTYSINGQAFRAYWLVIPGVSVWVYNFDESNWTVFSYTSVINVIGNFFKNQGIRIIDLVGTIASQQWTPATLNGNNPFEGFLLGFNNGVGGYVDFTNYSEVGALLASGKLTFQDRRHKHTVKGFRVSFLDVGPISLSITITNEKNQSETHTIPESGTIGSGSGDELSFVQGFNIQGLRLQYQINLASRTPAVITEVAPLYQVGGEQRYGTLEN